MPSKTSNKLDGDGDQQVPNKMELPGDSKHLREAKVKLDAALDLLASEIAENYRNYNAATTLVEMRRAIGPLLTTLTHASRQIPPLHITFEREIRLAEGA